jgi:hypothetical protein
MDRFVMAHITPRRQPHGNHGRDGQNDGAGCQDT